MIYVKDYTTDLEKGLVKEIFRSPLVQADKNAHMFQIHVINGSQQETLSGDVTAYFIRPDNSTLIIDGSFSSNVASVILPESAYSVIGPCQLIIKSIVGSTRTAIAWIECNVIQSTTDTIVDPGHVIPDISELLAKIAEMEAGTTAANAAAAAATASAGNADAKATLANNAAGTANTAANNADAKATLANNAAGTANTAANNADAKASLANAAATAANNAASAASEATTEANRLNIDASKTGKQTSVVITKKDGTTKTVLILDGGNNYYSGTAITGTSTTPTAYQTGITDAVPGDRYYYNGTSSANIGNVYKCTTGGNQTNARWVYDGNIRGAVGDGSVNFVNGVEPDTDGNVLIDASDIHTNGQTGNTVAQDLSLLNENKVDTLLAFANRDLYWRSGFNIDSINLEPGSYYVASCNGTTTGLPSTTYFRLDVFGCSGELNRLIQIYQHNRNNGIYIRFYDGVWTSWTKIATETDIVNKLPVPSFNNRVVLTSSDQSPSGSFTAPRNGHCFINIVISANNGYVDVSINGVWSATYNQSVTGSNTLIIPVNANDVISWTGLNAYVRGQYGRSYFC